VSAREWRAVREGETHAATKTSNSNTPESFIVGVGASGALLAGAAIVFVTLVGLVSFNVWPAGNEISVDGNVELSTATPGGASAGSASPVSAAAGQVASTSVPSASAGGGGTTSDSGGDNGGSGGGNGGQPKGGLTNPGPATSAPPSTGNSGSGDSTGQGKAPGSATKGPGNPVNPSHPGTSHGNVGDGTTGKDDPGSGDGSGTVTGKGPFGRPTEPSSSDSGGTDFSGHGRGPSSPGHHH
jgi:hypothetical protein